MYHETWVLFSSIFQMSAQWFVHTNLHIDNIMMYPLQKSTIQLCNCIILDDTEFDWMKIGHLQRNESRVVYAISPYQYRYSRILTESLECNMKKKNGFD